MANANVIGQTNWADANSWATSLNINGVTGWKLPSTDPINGMNYDYTASFDGSSDAGYNMGAPGTIYEGSQASEMAYIFYNLLGNTGFYDTAGVETGCTPPDYCLTNTGPFENIQIPFTGGYWSGTEYGFTEGDAWFFSFYDGYQENYDMTSDVLYAWAVRDGGSEFIPQIPIPAAIWLFGSGLIGLIGSARRKSFVNK